MNNQPPTTLTTIGYDTPPQQLMAVDAKTLAEMLCCSVRHVERQDVSGKLPAPIRIGRAKRWRITEIDAWLEAGCPDRREWNAMKGGSP